jgi:YVTN family beta-propeller protein
MKRLLYALLFFIIFLPAWYACLPDRMAPDPVDISRPEFVSFSSDDSAGINVQLDDPIIMTFNKKMDPGTFYDNFTLESISGEINGTFRRDDNADSVVVFTPSENMNSAEVYTASVFGGVRDVNGNSMLSPNEADIPQTTWFFTTGQYAQNGFPHVFFVDRNGVNLFLVQNIDSYLAKTTITTETTYGSGEMRFTPDGSKLVIANRLASGTISIFDPETMTEITTVSVGVGPEDLFVSNDKAYVVNISARTISVVDLNSYSELDIIEFSDGFRPRDIVYSETTNKLYVSSNLNTNYGTLRVIDANDYANSYDIEDVTPNGRQTIDMEISKDGQFIFIAEFNTTSMSVFSTSLDSVVKIIDHGTSKNEDGTISADYYYLVSNDGNVFKIDVNSHAIISQLELGRTASGIDVTAADEILYIVTPNDSTAQIIATGTMKVLRNTKIPGILKRVAISVDNY